MNPEEMFAIVRERFPEAGIREVLDNRDPYLLVPAAGVPDICRFCRDDPRLRCGFLQCLTGVDHLDRMAVVYHLESVTEGHRLVLKAEIPRDDPRIPSVSALWRAADWHEREAYDLLGIVFEGHPDLRRILCAEDWEGHPLRKDYEFPREYHGIACNFAKARVEWAERAARARGPQEGRP